MSSDNSANDKNTSFSLRISYEKPPFAAEVGNLFSEISDDYASETGRALVLLRLTPGSIYAVFQDAVAAGLPIVWPAIEYMKSVNAVYGFARMLRDAYSLMETGVVEKDRGGNTILAALEVITNSQSVIEFDYTSKDGDRIGFKITPMDAIRIEERSRKPLLRPRTQKRKAKSALLIPDNRPSVKELVPTFDAEAGSSDADDVKSLAQTLVSALDKAGLSAEATRIMHLSQRIGRDDLAKAINQLTRERRPRLPREGSS